MTVLNLGNRILSALLALTLVLGGLLAALEIILAAADRRPWLVPHPQWSAWLSRQSWNDVVVITSLVGLVIIGLLLLVLSLRRGKPAALTLSTHLPEVQITVSRRGLEKSLAAVASRTTGVTHANASAGRKGVRIHAHTASRSQADLREQIAAAVTERLDALGLADRLQPRVRVSQRDTR